MATLATRRAVALAFCIFGLLFFFPQMVLQGFTDSAHILREGPPVLRVLVAAFPLVGFQVITAAVYQALGRIVPSLLLSISRQALFLIPLLLFLPEWLGLTGVWLSFPLADFLATSLALLFFRRLRPLLLSGGTDTAEQGTGRGT